MRRRKLPLVGSVAIILAIGFAIPASSANEFTPDSITKIMKRVAEYRLKLGIQKYGDGFVSHWDWDDGAYMTGVVAVYRHTREQRYLDTIKAWSNAVSWKTKNDNGLSRNPDNQCVCQTFCEAYLLDPKPANEYMVTGWKANYHLNYDNAYSEWYWCDALYMAPPAIAMLTAINDSTRYLDTLSKRWWKWAATLYSPQYHLYWRDAGYIPQTAANGKPVFWGPGDAWVLGGMARVLKYMPKNYAQRDTFVNQFREQCTAVAALQQGNGLWTTSLLDSLQYPDDETSCTAFFCFAMAWGINNGVLDSAKFGAVARKAWSGLVANVSPVDGRLQRCQGVSSAPGSVGVSNSSAEGEGAFLLAAEEMYKLVGGKVNVEQGNVTKAMRTKNAGAITTRVINIDGSNCTGAACLPGVRSVQIFALDGSLVKKILTQGNGVKNIVREMRAAGGRGVKILRVQ
jgi:unsaturated rhamnogalacturonyl hydrolase